MLKLIVPLIIAFAAGSFFLYQNFQTKSTPQKEISTQEKRAMTSSPTHTKTQNTQNNEESNWEIYTASAYSYSIKYLNGWEITEAKPRVGNEPVWSGGILIDKEVQKVTFTEKGSKLWPGQFQVRVLSNPDRLTLDQWTQNYKEESAAGANLARLIDDVILANNPAKRFSIFSFDRNEEAIVTLHDGNVYYLRFDSDNPNDPDFEKHKDIYAKMVSSFKFLNPI